LESGIMERRTKKPYSIKKVETIPIIKKAREPIYDELVEEVLKMDRGFYEVSFENKNPKTVYQALKKRIRDKPLKLHLVKNKLYLERTS
jgi:hypothetical protein